MVLKCLQKSMENLMDFWIAPETAPGHQKALLRDSVPSVLGPGGVPPLGRADPLRGATFRDFAPKIG